MSAQDGARRATTLRLPEDLAERLRLIAFLERRPQSTIIVEALEARVSDLEAEHGKRVSP